MLAQFPSAKRTTITSATISVLEVVISSRKEILMNMISGSIDNVSTVILGSLGFYRKDGKMTVRTLSFLMSVMIVVIRWLWRSHSTSKNGKMITQTPQTYSLIKGLHF